MVVVLVQDESIITDSLKGKMVSVRDDYKDVNVFDDNVRCKGILVSCAAHYSLYSYDKEKHAEQMCNNVFDHAVINNVHGYYLCLSLSKVFFDSF